ncbi:unnamed protein product [Adineta steineri]|uniref:Uncharacterized protein n=1 Tax=Adineta steineri TaxID=433720 RepID=A0A814Q825_9BILA|nr:unnamed protein product [Adineta steineri]
MSLKLKSNLECSSMKVDKSSKGKRLTKVLSKLLWHFNQAVPTYTPTASRRVRSFDRCIPNSYSDEEKKVMDKNRVQFGYIKNFRMHSIRQRTTTLTSIKEENENDIMNCK